MLVRTEFGEGEVTHRLGSSASGAVKLSQQRDASETKHSKSEGLEETEPGASDAGGGDNTDDPDASEGEPNLPLDQVFEVLKNSRRRETLHYLADNDGKSSLSDLAEHIAALENDTTVAAISSSQRKRVYVGLYQCHLPKMDDMDIIDFDQNRGTVVLSTNAAQLYPYLEDSDEQPWYRVYGSITAAGGVLFLVSLLANAPLGLTPTVVLAALLIAMGAASLSHVRYREN